MGRFNVDLARQLASAGVASLRFDLSGLGDSVMPEGTLDDSARLLGDLKQAMDFMQSKCGSVSFVVVGVCSGTDGVHAAAVGDSRVVGAVYVDGYAYTTPGYYARRYAERAAWAFQAFRWRRWLRRASRRLRGLPADLWVESGVREVIFDRRYPPREQFRGDLDLMVERGVRLLFIYSVDGWNINRASQFAPMVGWRSLPEGVLVERWPGADHLFGTLATRRMLVDRITGWLTDFLNTGLPLQMRSGVEPGDAR
jgi:hypothetical protein